VAFNESGNIAAENEELTAHTILAIIYEKSQVEAKEEVYETYLATKAHPAQT